MSRARRSPRTGESGQVLVIFAVMVLVLLAVSGLAIDVTRAYASARDSRSVADAAALAGTQDLQGPTRAAVTAAQRRQARLTTIGSLQDQLGQTADPACGDGSVDIVDCSFAQTGHLVSVKTPSPSCSICDPLRSVQVTVRVPDFQTSFARVVGQSSWNVGVTSVAGLSLERHYSVIALRPPNPRRNSTDANQVNIDVNGSGTSLTIHGGDIASNTSVFTNAAGYIDLDPDYLIYHVDDITPDPWNKNLAGEPGGVLVPDLFLDPGYPVPVEPTRVFATQAAGLTPCLGILPIGLPLLSKCYLPGTYEADFDVRQNTDIAYLAPGVYSFRGDMSISGTLIGGRDSSQPGVVLRFRQDRTLAGNNAVAISINEGSVGCASSLCRPAAVVDEAGTSIATPTGVPLSIVIPRDEACFSDLTPILCTDNNNDTITLPGGGNLAVTGVIYAPSDFVKVSGNRSASSGTLGQLFVWRITYSGGAQLHQAVLGEDEPGVLRLDAACTAPAEPCHP